MKDVDDAALTRLLDLQAEDTAIRQLDHRKDSLPESARLAEKSERLAELEADMEIARKQVDEVAREQQRIEGEIELRDQKIEREEKRMFSGTVANPRELSALQAELEMLRRQKSEQEDSLLEVMVQHEQAAATLENLTSEHSELKRETDDLSREVSGLTGEIDAQRSEHATRREEIVGEIPEQLLKLYDKLRAEKGGIGAAALEGGTCTGCHTQLPAVEVERLRHEGGLQRCDNCRRILVVR
jgi:uncharacterized protein